MNKHKILSIVNVLTTNLIQPSKDREVYQWLRNGNFETLDAFDKFINWLSGEFILYQQELSNEFIVYFPNGHFIISKIETNSSTIKFKIEVCSKCLNGGQDVNDKIDRILNQLKGFLNMKE